MLQSYQANARYGFILINFGPEGRREDLPDGIGCYGKIHQDAPVYVAMYYG